MPKTTTTVETSSKSPQIPPAITYRLSEPYYLAVGWTAPPLLSQRVHYAITMKAKFSHPNICPWFKERNESTVGHYSDGRLLYSASKNGTGKIYYPNGKVAFKIKKVGGQMPRTQVWVYDSGDVDRDGVTHTSKFCALFDSLGNGIVYDRFGNRRLVYNQEEGICYRSNQRVLMRWKWHNIHVADLPPAGIKSGVFDDDPSSCALVAAAKTSTLMTQTPTQALSKKSLKSSDSVSYDPGTILSKAEIEFRNRIEHERYMNTGMLKPREVTPVKPIVMELNNYIALRILDQSNISLTFFARSHHVKLNIGVLFNPYEKLKVSKVEVEPEENEILCPFEHFLAKSQSSLKFRQLAEKLKTNSSGEGRKQKDNLRFNW